MTIISTEMLKWKRNKTVLGIFILTAILGIFAVERAFSISRSSSLMNSFSDLYTLAFKNLTSLFLPIVLSMFATTLFFDEQKNDTLKGLLIIPISKTQLYFSKILHICSVILLPRIYGMLAVTFTKLKRFWGIVRSKLLSVMSTLVLSVKRKCFPPCIHEPPWSSPIKAATFMLLICFFPHSMNRR